MVAKKYQSPSGGLNSAGRAYFRRKEGANLSPPVTGKPKSDREKARKVSFAARFAGMKGPMKDEQGRPTRKALSVARGSMTSLLRGWLITALGRRLVILCLSLDARRPTMARM
jgi:hypothetical protein